MKLIKAPIDMTAVFHSGEPPEPVRFKYKRDGNTRDYTYRCQSLIGRRQCIYEIRYNGQEVRWELYKTQ